jgi:hypothetical protein
MCKNKTFHRRAYVSKWRGSLPLHLKDTDEYAEKNHLHILTTHWASRDLPHKFSCLSKLSLGILRLSDGDLDLL